MSEILRFTIPGAAVGKGRPRFARRGNFVSTYTPEKTASYENLVKLSAASAMNGQELHCVALGCAISVRVIPPQGWSKKKRLDALCGVLRPTTKPDLDNVAKCILDAMNGIAYADDKQVVDLTISKRYAEIAETEVVIREAE